MVVPRSASNKIKPNQLAVLKRSIAIRIEPIPAFLCFGITHILSWLGSGWLWSTKPFLWSAKRASCKQDSSPPACFTLQHHPHPSASVDKQDLIWQCCSLCEHGLWNENWKTINNEMSLAECFPHQEVGPVPCSEAALQPSDCKLIRHYNSYPESKTSF